MKRSIKLLLGAATIWPVVYLILFVVGFLCLFLFMGFVIQDLERSLPAMEGTEEIEKWAGLARLGFVAVFALHFFTMLLTLGLLVFYIVHAINNESLESNAKIIWAVVLFMAALVAMPIYWYMQIWKDGDSASGRQTSTPNGTLNWQ